MALQEALNFFYSFHRAIYLLCRIVLIFNDSLIHLYGWFDALVSLCKSIVVFTTCEFIY